MGKIMKFQICSPRVGFRQILESLIQHFKKNQQKGNKMSDLKISHGLKTRVSSRSITISWKQLLISRFCEKIAFCARFVQFVRGTLQTSTWVRAIYGNTPLQVKIDCMTWRHVGYALMGTVIIPMRKSFLEFLPNEATEELLRSSLLKQIVTMLREL